MTETPEQFATRIWAQAMSQWSTIDTFRQLGRWGLPLASSQAHKQHADLANKLAFDSEYAKYLKDQKAFVDLGLAVSLPIKMTERAVGTFETALDAASLVFAHSVLDSAAHDYLRLSAMLGPKDFLPFVGGKKLSLTEIEGQSFDVLLKNLIDAHLKNFEKESVIRKIDFLFQLCRPPSGYAPMEGYSYSRERLVSLDNLRHKIVHSIGPALRVPQGDRDIEFLLKTTYFLFGLIHERYGIKTDPSYIEVLWSNKTSNEPSN